MGLPAENPAGSCGHEKWIPSSLNDLGGTALACGGYLNPLCRVMNKPVQPAPLVAAVTGAANPHFDRLGGTETITRLVDRFYFHMDTLPEAAGIRVMHPADLSPIKQVLVLYLTEWMGGPKQYSQERGHPRLRFKHSAFAIGPAERDAWMACMRLALEEAVPDATLKAQLEQSFMKIADFIRNDQGHLHEPR